MFSNASPEKLRWAGEEMSFQKVEGSTFEVKEDQDSPGIQVADVVLWLYSQLRKGKPLPDGCRSLIKYVLEVGWENDFSFKGVQREYMRQFGPMLAKPMTEEGMASAREVADTMENARKRSMQRYEQDQLPPFMRGQERTVIGTEDSE